MIFLLSKILVFLIKPLVWVFGLFLIAAFTKHAKQRKKIFIVGVVVLFIFSNRTLVNLVLRSYEPHYETYHHYDVGIVLGGFAGLNKENGTTEFNRSGDRIFQAIHLYKSGVIKKILISGGSINQQPIEEREAYIVARYLKGIGIPDSSILIKNESRNTIENAINSLKMMTKIQPKAKILVITSAVHVPRARLIFSKLSKKQLAYYPTDYLGTEVKIFPDFFIPNPDALLSWEILIKEWVGLVVDRFRA